MLCESEGSEEEVGNTPKVRTKVPAGILFEALVSKVRLVVYVAVPDMTLPAQDATGISESAICACTDGKNAKTIAAKRSL